MPFNKALKEVGLSTMLQLPQMTRKYLLASQLIVKRLNRGKSRTSCSVVHHPSISRVSNSLS